MRNKVKVSKRCKECGVRYLIGPGIGHAYRKHMHGKNSGLYGNNGWLGKHHTEETKEKIRITLAGKKPSEYNRMRTIEANTGKKHSDKTKRKMSASASLANKKKWAEGKYDGVHTGPRVIYREDLGIFFRSRWEANFARVLNYLGVKWEYEIKRFNTPHGSYTPDFYLPDQDIYIEVKGRYYPDLQISKRNFCRENGITIRMLRLKEYRRLIDLYSKKINNWEY